MSPRTASGLVLAALPVAAWRAAPDGACTQVNAPWSDLTGLREEEALGDGWLAAVHPDDRVRADAAWRAALAGGPAFAIDVRYLRRDGSVRHVVSSAAPEPGGDGMLGVVVDVTESRLAEVRRAARDDASDEGLLVLAHDGAVLEANRRALALLDLSAEEVAGLAPVPEGWRIEPVRGAPAAAPPAAALVDHAEAAGGEVALRLPDGARRWLRVAVRRVAVEADGSHGVVAVLGDETTERRERRIAQALHEVAAVVAADPTVDALCAVLAGAASSVLELDRSAVCHVEHDGTVRVLAHVPLGEGHPRPGDEMPRGSGTAVERAIAAGGPVRLLAPPPLTGRAERVGEAVAYPITVEGRVWGTISAGAHAGRRVSPDAEVHLARLAELAAVAISSADTHERLRALAVTDSLTGLPNARRFEERLVAEVARARRTGAPLALVVLDLDAFKAVNDTLGHPVGDSVLRAVADALRAVSRVGETVCRIGGEEFAWLLPSADAGRALGAAERARARIEADTAQRSVRVTASAGICDLETAGSGGDLVRLADAALYAAKRGGRDRSVVQRAPGGAGERMGIAALLADEAGQERARPLVRDALTGLPGRDALVLRLGEALARREPAALLLVQVEDAPGGGAPDALRAVALVLGELAQPGELVARALGRELACLLPGADGARALAAARRARAQLIARGLADGGRLPVAIAVAVLEAGAEDAEGVLRRASEALLVARLGEGDRIATAPPVRDVA